MTPVQPLTPPDCDLQDFKFMPLDVQRLRDSDLASDETPECCWAAVLLWAASWHQVPAASMPDNEQWIAKHAGYVAHGKISPRWKNVRAGAMRGWVLCGDGRYYHPVVAEKAKDAWISKLRQRLKTECARIKQHNHRHSTELPYPVFEEWMAAGCPVGQPLPVPGDNSGVSPGQVGGVTGETPSKRQGEGQRQGQGQGSIPSDGAAAPPPPGLLPAAVEPPAPTAAPKPPAKRRAAAPKPEAPTNAAWDAYAEAYERRYRARPNRNASDNGKLANFVAKVGGADAPAIAAFYLTRRIYVGQMHPLGLLSRDAQAIRTQWLTGLEPGIAAPASARAQRMAQAMGGVGLEGDSSNVIDAETTNVTPLAVARRG